MALDVSYTPLSLEKETLALADNLWLGCLQAIPRSHQFWVVQVHGRLYLLEALQVDLLKTFYFSQR